VSAHDSCLQRSRVPGSPIKAPVKRKNIFPLKNLLL
jgi:hypothetical protein